MTIECNDELFQNVVVDSTVPVLVDFWAPWCPPCRAMGPLFKELALEYTNKVKFVKVNVDDCPLTAKAYEARSIPLFLLFKDGKVVKSVLGAGPKSMLDDMLKEVLNAL